MKRLSAMVLALVMCLGMVSCADSDSSSKTESKAKASSSASKEGSKDSAADSMEEPAVPLNTNVVNAELDNNVLSLKATFDIANIDGFETQETSNEPDDYRAMGGYGCIDPEWYSSAVNVNYTLRVISAEHVEDLKNKANDYSQYDKTDLGSSYDTYMRKDPSYDNKYDLVFVGGDYLDGAYVLEMTAMTQLDSGKAEDVDLIIDTFAKSLKLEADDSTLKTSDGFSLAMNGITCKDKATVAGQDVDLTQCVFQNDNCISAQTDFTADDIGYRFYTYSVESLDYFGKDGGGDYADCTLAGKPGKIKVSLGVGTLEIDADIQIDDENCLHMSISSDSALQQGELADSVKLAAKFEEMLNDDNKEATQEKFVGYFNDILGSFTFA